MSKQRGGRVHLEVQELFWEDNEDKFTELLLDVGHLAQVLHLPIEWFHAQCLARYKRDIEEADNNIETWAAKLIVKGFERAVANREEEKRVQLSYMLDNFLPPSVTEDAIDRAIKKAYQKTGLNPAEKIKSREEFVSVFSKSCEKLLDDQHMIKRAIDHVKRRLESYMRLYELRKIFPEDRKEYEGIPDPSKVPFTFLRVTLILYQVLIKVAKPPERNRRRSLPFEQAAERALSGPRTASSIPRDNSTK